MEPLALESPLLDSGVRSVNFFNGRLLTANDLRREQEVRRIHDRWLGQAIGDGVAWGLEVRKHPDSTVPEPLVTVEPGLAVNRDGQALCLKSQATIALVRKSKAAATVQVTFEQCGKLQTGTYVTGPGIYLLTIAPASTKEGKALTSGFDQYGGKCNTDAIVETVQFRLIEIDTLQLGLSVPADNLQEESRFRNLLATRCLRLASPIDPFAGRAADPLYELVGNPLSCCDVPLALVYWTLSGGIRFIDEWSVRRRLDQLGPRAHASGWLRPWASALGEARLLQFIAQLEDLLARDAHPEERGIEDFFRYVPAAACVPVKGAGSSGGFGPSRFLAAFTHGSADRMTQGMAAEVLDRSFAVSALDLTAKPDLQVYEIDENVAAMSAGAATRRYHLYVGRVLHGPASRDSVTTAFEGAWTVYRGLVRRRVFLPVDSTPADVAAQISIVGAIRDVMEVANRHAARASAWSLDSAAALEALGLLYTVQQELSELLASDIPGVPDTQQRKQFASVLNPYLNQTLPGSKPALKSALDEESLPQAVQAQEVINQFVGTWSGEGVAIGPFGFTFGHSDNAELVPGAAAAAQFFTLSNGTDRTLTIMLTAEASAPTGNWATSTKILGAAAGNEIDRATLASGASREIVVTVGAPSNAAVGEAVTLTLTAEVGPPTSRTTTYSNGSLLKVATTGGGPVTGQVEIREHRFNPVSLNPADITPNLTFGLLASLTYSAADGVARDFDLDIEVSAGDAGLWLFRHFDTTDPLPPLPGGNGFRLRMSGVPADGSPAVGRLRIQAPQRGATVDRSVTLSLSIRSVDLTPALSHQYPPDIVLVVKHA